MKLSDDIGNYLFSNSVKSRQIEKWLKKAEHLEAQIDKLKDALNKIERHRDSTLWPQNETVESMARIAKETLEMIDE